MTESTMQYLVSLSDRTVENLLRLQAKWGWNRDQAITEAINYMSNSDIRPEQERRKKSDEERENEYR